MRCALLALALLLACAARAEAPPPADPLSDAPEAVTAPSHPLKPAASYAAALQAWAAPEDVNAWIAAHFRYDMARALQLSETQRAAAGRMAIHPPQAFFDAPRGVCVDLSRFAVETLRAIAPATRPAYLMIEFDPVAIAGNTLRRHWVASFQRGSDLYFFADSKRPGHIAGPYPSNEAFLADYAAWRGRKVVAHRVLESYERRQRTLATRQERSEHP